MKQALTTFGFSLVELSLALGITSLCLVTAVGLLGSSLQAHRLSGDDTTLVSMTEAILSDLRGDDFDSLWNEVPGATATTLDPKAVPKDSHFYFTQEGDPVDGSDR